MARGALTIAEDVDGYSNCRQPEQECFNIASIDPSALDFTDEGKERLAPCSKSCVGFTASQIKGTISLCSLNVSDYLYRFDRENNYVGFIFAAVKSGGKWYYNEKAYHAKRYKNGRMMKNADIRTGYVIVKQNEVLEKKYGASTSVEYQQALLEDFFGLNLKQMVRKGLFFLGWGFSYKAVDSQTKEITCDYKFNTATANEGLLFGKEPRFDHHYKGRHLHHMLGNFFRLGLNKMRSNEHHSVEVGTLLHFHKFYAGQTQDYLPRCETEPETQTGILDKAMRFDYEYLDYSNTTEFE